MNQEAAVLDARHGRDRDLIVVKLGGGAGIDHAPLAADIATRVRAGERLVVVHGASDGTTELQEALGRPPRFVTSVSGHVSRFTDRAALEALTMAAARLNLRIVAALQGAGVDAVGLTGASGRLLEARRKSAIKIIEGDKKVVLRGDHTGVVERVNTRLLHMLLDAGQVPVITVPAVAEGGTPVNVDADRAAAAVAGALGAARLVVLSNVAGLLANIDEPASLVPTIAYTDFDAAEALAHGRFRKKMMAARAALDAGVARVVFAHANEPAPLTRALQGAGTHLFAPTPALEVVA